MPISGTIQRLSLAVVFGITSYSVQAAEIETEIEAYADLRLFDSSGEQSWFDRGLGKARYGEETGLELAEVALEGKMHIGWDWSVFVHLGYANELSAPLDLVEGFVTYKPAPRGRTAYSVKAGLFFPPITRENIGIAWTSPFSITPSAINAWVGEELKSLGGEVTVRYRFNRSELRFKASLFGVNETAGALLFFRGWALHDVKSAAFSDFPLPPTLSIQGSDTKTAIFPDQSPDTIPNYAVDGRVGYYGAAEWTNKQSFTGGVLYYNNRARPDSLENGQYGWRTKFWHMFAEYRPDDHWTFLSQAMTGTTEMGDVLVTGGHPADIRYSSAFILASRQKEDWTVSARAEVFDINDRSVDIADDASEHGTSLMLSVGRKLNDTFSIFGEWLHINSDRITRADLSIQPDSRVNQFQLSLRARF